MGLATNQPLRQQIVILRQNGQSYTQIGQDLGLHYNTVRQIYRRYEAEGQAGLKPRYAKCGKTGVCSSHLYYRASLWLKRRHPKWGAPLILLLLEERYGRDQAPSVRTLQRWFRAAGLNVPRQKHNAPHIGRSQAVHNIWQVDAKEQLQLEDGQPFCYLTVVDEKSGAWLEAPIFPL